MKLLRAILAGWATLLGMAFLIERPVLDWTAPLFGAVWIATVALAFDCVALFAAGWVAGRCNRPRAIRTGLLFAATLCCWAFTGMLALNFPGLIGLLWNSFHDSGYLDALLMSGETHVFLFGCLMGGAALGREKEKPVSIVS